MALLSTRFSATAVSELARLRNAPPQHFFDVITDGAGVMYPYASRISPRDRWAIVAYIRALQLSTRAHVAESGEPGEAQP